MRTRTSLLTLMAVLGCVVADSVVQAQAAAPAAAPPPAEPPAPDPALAPPTTTTPPATARNVSLSPAAQIADQDAPATPDVAPQMAAPAPDGTDAPRISGNFVAVRAGIARGGDPVVADRLLPAGDGKLLAVAGGATLWWTGMVGYGVTLELGWKQETVAAYGGTVTLRRFPASISAHLIAQAGAHSFVTTSAGVTVDEVPTLIAVNASEGDEPLPSRIGMVAEAGYRHSFGSNFAIDAAVRLTALNYERGRALVSANSLGLVLGASYHFDR